MPIKDNVGNPAPPAYELTITRTFDAPRELVWRAWTDPVMAKEWMGPRGFRCVEFETAREEGQRWSLAMEGNIPGTDDLACMRQGGTTLEVKPPELLRYTFAWEQRSSAGLESSPYKNNVVTVRFEEAGKNRTTVHFHHAPFATEGERNGHNGGWNSSFDKFAEFLAAHQPTRVEDPNEPSSELHLKRTFRAPCALVFEAWAKPEVVAQWWGPEHFRTQIEQWEPTSGGPIRATMIAPDGTRFPMGGRFVEVYPTHRLHFIVIALDTDGNALFQNWNSVFFEEKDGDTIITLDVHVMSKSAPIADQYLKGMKPGWNQSLDRLATLLGPKS